MTTVAEMIVRAIADQGVRTVWGVVGDALNPVTDAIRREERLEWIGVRHEEVGAFAAGAQAQLSGTLGVCMGTVGPGSVHLLNGLYDARKSHAPVLALCGQVPLADLGSDMFQEVDNDLLFRDVACFTRTITSAEHATTAVEAALQSALTESGVAVLTLPGDLGDLDLPDGAAPPRVAVAHPPTVPDAATLDRAVELVDGAKKVTLLVGIGARDARDEVLALAQRLQAPTVLTLKAKENLERDNPFEVGQSGLLGNPGATDALGSADLLVLIGTDFPYRAWLPQGPTVIQLDARAQHIGRRTSVDLGLVGHAAPTLRVLTPRLRRKKSSRHLDAARATYASWRSDQDELAEPGRPGLLSRVRGRSASGPVRPEQLARAIDRLAPSDAVFTVDTGMSTTWLARFVHLSGTRRLLGSFNLGSMANAMPQALGAAALDRTRPVVALCGDGGLSMLLGDLATAVAHDLPVTLVVFGNGRLGEVTLEQEVAGLPAHGTDLHDLDLAAVGRAVGLWTRRVDDPAELDGALREALTHSAAGGPTLLDVRTDPSAIPVPPEVSAGQVAGFAKAKAREAR